MSKAILLCGSNIGDRFQHIEKSELLMESTAQIHILKHSSFYETAPWGDTEQSAFLNKALLIETALSPYELLDFLKSIETKIGRETTRRWGPRVLDIDILYYDDLLMKEPDLCIPHAEVQNRAFALVPAAEIAPDWMDFRNKKSIAKLSSSCADKLDVKKIVISKNAV